MGTTGTTGCGGGVLALGVKADEDEDDSLKLLSRLGGGSTSDWAVIQFTYTRV